MKNYFFLLVFTSTICFSQEPPLTAQQQLENLADQTESELNEAEEQWLLDYLKNPLNLNRATAEELQTLRLLTDLQIANFLRYRELLGRLVDKYELQAVPSWDLVTIKKLLPYIIISDDQGLKESFINRLRGIHTVLFRASRVLQRAKGYDTSLFYLGDRNHLMLRYRYQYKDLLSFGLTADKDAGEPFSKQGAKGFDFYSFHVFIRKMGVVKALAIGDYTVNLGQGLIHWQSSAFGKSADAMSIKRSAPVLQPYRSAGEFYFNRGAAVTLQKGKWEATVFGSLKKVSANIAFDSIEVFSALNTSGLYRTAAEQADRKNLRHHSFGGNLSYRTSQLKIGLNTVVHAFDKPMKKRDEPYNYFAFTGKRLANAGIDYSYTRKNTHFFGEVAVDMDGNRAFVQGLIISADATLDISFLYRNISKRFQSFNANAFTENTQVQNETGWYTGISIRPSASWHLSAHADFYHFPWLRYRVNAPSVGHDYLVQWNFVPDRNTEFYIRFKTEHKAVNNFPAAVMNPPAEMQRQNFRMHLSKTINRQLSFRSRLELVWYDRKGPAAEEGMMAYAELHARPTSKIGGSLRLQYFETDGYNSRIYAYEPDVLYNNTIPAVFDRGYRLCLNFNIDLTKKMTAWGRLAGSFYKNRSVVGSALEEIRANHRSEARMQLLYEF